MPEGQERGRLGQACSSGERTSPLESPVTANNRLVPLAPQGRDMTAEEEQPQTEVNYAVALKSGGRIDARMALARIMQFERELQLRPELITALCEAVEGKLTVLSPGLEKEFRDRIWLASEGGDIRDEVKSVFLASYRLTPDGPCFVDPFRLNNTEERHTVEQLKEARRSWLKELIQGSRPDDADYPGRQ